jgi:hypothetical protein
MPALSKPLKVMADKMKCLWKPAQSGKTRTMQELIRADDGVKNHLNILICSNNRLLVAQTNARMVDDLYADSPNSVEEEGPADDAVVGGVYSWMSGTKKSNISSRDLALRVLLGEVSMVVCCSHKKRFLYLVEMIEFLERLNFSKPVNVWIDEADVSVKHWSGDFDFSRFRCVREMTLVSATFDAVFDHYDRIRVMPFPETHPDCYVGLRDCDLQAFDAPGRAAEYLDAVLTAHPELVKPGMKLFIPGDIERVSHDAIEKKLGARGFCVLVLNGERKEFVFPNGEKLSVSLVLDEENPTELSNVLAEVYASRKLHEVPFAVTGQLCLGRGITFQSRGFTFDAAIVPSMKDAAAYQCVARVLGNVRSFVGPFTPTVYMSSGQMRAVQRQERIATNLAKLVHEEKWVDVGVEEIGLAAGDGPAPPPKAQYNDDDYEVVWTREFTSVEELKAAKVTHGRMPEMGDDGFYKNANGGKGPMSRTQLNALKAGKKTTNMRLPLAEVGDSTKRTYPFYEDPADPSTLRFVVRTLTRIH